MGSNPIRATRLKNLCLGRVLFKEKVMGFEFHPGYFER